VQDPVKKIREIHESGVTVLLIEQSVDMALGIPDRAYNLEVFRSILRGKSKAFIKLDQLKKAY
jgi:branched-chain amino acid transport system ATP-binding protein